MEKQKVYTYKCPKCGFINKRVYKAKRVICDKCHETFIPEEEKLVKKRFAFSEPVETILFRPYTTMKLGDTIKINDKYYQVAKPPKAFSQMTRKGRMQGWIFEAEQITNKETIKLLNQKKKPCLILNPTYVTELKMDEHA